jgi:hypothetical protein
LDGGENPIDGWRSRGQTVHQRRNLAWCYTYARLGLLRFVFGVTTLYIYLAWQSETCSDRSRKRRLLYIHVAQYANNHTETRFPIQDTDTKSGVSHKWPQPDKGAIKIARHL